MGRMLGAYDADELDRPDLNKCPDCGCFFATDACPLCEKVCPEEMRAGHRAKVKPVKRKPTSGRVQFIEWYHTWPVMIILSILMPPVGIVLFATSPYSKKVKIGVVAACVVATVLYTGVGSRLIGRLFEDPLVNDKLSRAEYIEACTEMTAEEFYRSAEKGAYVTMELTVIEQLPSSWFGEDSDTFFYRCRSPEGRFDILLRDCMLEDQKHLLQGDMIRVWGENAGSVEYYPAYDRTETYPCLNTAYCDLIG